MPYASFNVVLSCGRLVAFDYSEEQAGIIADRWNADGFTATVIRTR